MIDFFHKGAEMTKRITGVARLKGAPVVHERAPRRLTRLATFLDEEDVITQVLLEVADTEEERRRGLMGRTDIPPITGMLFEGLSNGGYFWMKGCRVPIDVVFLNDAGFVTKTYAMTVDGGKAHYAYDEEDVAAIELAGGFVSTWKIGKGHRVTIHTLNAGGKEAKHV